MSLFLFKKSVLSINSSPPTPWSYFCYISPIIRVTVRVFIFTTLALLSDTWDRRINISGVPSS